MYTSILKKTNIFLTLTLLLFATTACDSNDDDPELGDIVQVATDGGFDTLVAAVAAADLVATLQGPGPFTVFAPTDAAFAALPAGTLDNLLLPENQATLAGILTYHVVSGNVTAEQVVNLTTATTVQGDDIAITVVDGTVFVNGIEVTQTDIEASNGVIHVINGVLLP
ncbi:MAG: fasciclin domain-containing protein [Rhodothermales bacterium]